MFARMALVYADDIRKELKALERRIKDLAWREHRFRKEELRLRHLNERYALGSPAHIRPDLLKRCVALTTEATNVAAEIHQQERIVRDLQERLKTAPKRPRSRTHKANIAASGSKAFNATLKNGKPVKVAWADAMDAALATSRKYAASSVSEDAKMIIRKRAIKRHPKLRSEIVHLR